MVNLTVGSILHFMPDADICALNLYKDSEADYDSQPKLFTVKQFFRKSKYTNMGPSVGNTSNNLFFSEGYNYIADIFKDCDEKVLMIAEDHFFTNGKTLEELKNIEFDIAYAPWDSITNHGANGSILCVRPKRTFFPIPEVREPVEGVFQKWIDSQSVTKHRLSTRAAIDYKDDGFYSNDENEIRSTLKRLAIIR